MKPGRVRYGAAVALVVASMPLADAQSGRAPLFERLAGSWSGAGTAEVEGASPERIRCRADYSPGGPTSLRLALRCASDSLNLQIESAIARDGDRISGSWTEASSGISGNLSGSVGPDGIRAVVSGLGVSAQLSMTVHGDSQSVTLASQGQITARASIGLRRS